MSKKLLGIDLGGTTIKFGILTLEGEVQEKWAIETNTLENGRHIVSDIVESLKHRLSLYGLTKDDFLGIGMGSPGAVYRTSKTVTGAFNLNWADTQEVGSVIEKEVGIPFFIDNDANVAALGERWVGAGANNPDVVFVTLGTGVGGGVIADGNLIHGVAGAGGEIGHMIVDPENGFTCTCGNKGCLETVASATGVVRVARQLAEQYEGSSAIKAAIDNGDTVTSKDIFIAAEDGDKFANSVVERVSRYLGLAAANISNILNPDSVVIGGGVSAAGEFLRSRVEKYFVTFAFPQVKKSTKIKIAELGNDAGIIGAASLANQQAS
ncbi:ROK family glucokinase [Streptococcus agalactiae]|uniref:ROK family glucokinase n=1 Tax=Streptococcus agalactiae TaxID=1311 RepID=UPI0002BBDF76|nr:ROK family glucokinase [Streptococcus agalactiae]AIX04292.1 ROK family protein [Streptococcus agalactiae CNCTC 10/84]EPT56713.1 glucokinase [Streptococcus agalactiae CCUG 25532]EPT85576.1 glucokinase [Streptococcus agalactiae BSU247]EPV20894.1 glucokinase [Streptococcus agalactiae GB00640]EPW98501.1 glucokinase [Streptococcus agalactiae MRI Z1-048]